MSKLTVDGVTFVVDECKKLSKEVFIKLHKDCFWLDRDEETREKMLADVYSRMTKKSKK